MNTNKTKNFSKKTIAMFFIIIILSLLLAFYILRWHSLYMDNNLERSIMTNYVSETLNYSEFSNFIHERGRRLIYIGISDDEKCRDFEKEFRHIIVKYQLKEEITYLNLKSERENVKPLKNTYFQKENSLSLPVLALFEDAQVVDYLKLEDVSMDSVLLFLRGYDMIHD